MSAPMAKIFPSISTSSASNYAHDKDSEYDFRKAVFGIRAVLKANRCLLTGTHGSGRTSLLFQCALSYASDGQRVVFITHSRFQAMPLSVHGAPLPDPLLMKQIHFLYYQDRQSLLQYLASIHTLPVCPDVVIVDDLDFYASHPKAQDLSCTIAVLCAHLVDAVTFIETQKAKNQAQTSDDYNPQCVLIASVASTSNCEVAQEHVYSGFLPTVLRISGVQGTDKVYQLSLYSNGTSQTTCIITYEIRDQITLLDFSTGESAFGTSQDFTQE